MTTDADSTASAGEIVSQIPGTVSTVLEPTGRITAQDIAGAETGTDAPVRPLTQTQSTPPAVQVPVNNGNRGDVAAPSTATNPGVGARGDDSPPTTRATTQQIINASFGTPANARIIPKPNILDQYASYTYSLSWYLLTPDQYNYMMDTGKRDVASWTLLMQSGGASSQVSDSVVAGRNQFFSLDYYMDDLEIESYTPGKGTNAAHCAAKMKFKVVEPNGLTLLSNLYQAVTNLYKNQNVSTKPNYASAQYCMVIRFYGYNDQGQLVQVGTSGTGAAANRSDPRAVVEKFYPFLLVDATFRVANRAIEYQIQAQPIGQTYNFGQDRGTIPFNFNLIGETIGDVLIGKPVGTGQPRGADGRRDTPQPNVSSPSNADSFGNSSNTGAIVDDLYNFTGDSDSPTTVVAP
jgi:hypothetical protein